jgi:uncharacterized protein (TIGR00266 family)
MEELSNTVSRMDIDVKFPLKPGATASEITLRPGQKIIAEGGSMIAMSSNIKMTTSTQQKKSGGIMKGLKRLISGENFFLNHYTAGDEGGKLWLGTTHVGDMDCKELNGESLVIQGGSYVACSENVSIDASWQGFKNLVSKESMFWVKATGKGTVIFNSFGAIYTIDVDGEHIVDTGHIVAFEESLAFSLTKAGKSWASSILGGEGLVCKFNGSGRVWIQSHNSTSFGSSLSPKLKPR